MHGFLFFHINFKISLLVSHKIKTLIKISVNLYINYEEIDIFLCCYPTHELGISLYLYLLYILLKKCLFIIYFWVFVAACWLSLVLERLSSMGFSLRWLPVLWSTGCRCTGFSSSNMWALRHVGFSSCGIGAR